MASTTERKGVAAVEKLFADIGWFFREQHVHDWGIDAHVEIVRDGRPTGELIALQIKSGTSFFVGEDGEAVPFRMDAKHLQYWLEHSMPVVIVLYNPESDTAYWGVLGFGAESSGTASGITRSSWVTERCRPAKTASEPGSLSSLAREARAIGQNDGVPTEIAASLEYGVAPNSKRYSLHRIRDHPATGDWQRAEGKS